MEETLLELRHEPVNTPRKGFEGENAFYAQWQTWANKVEDGVKIFDAVFMTYPWEVGQREATVAASFVTWLGTNCGQAFLSSARKLSEKLRLPLHLAYTMAWADENSRHFAVNGGFRTLELILLPADRYRNDLNFRSGHYEVALRDYETVDFVVQWLATERGQAFLSVCKQEMDRMRTLRELEELIAIGQGRSALANEKRKALTQIETSTD